ncbi:MAG: aldehyde dehydrogenase family protein [Bacillaceae bacterium]|nr:aldehyde dehydrogenase family protein [Bacillaceae bacterium]
MDISPDIKIVSEDTFASVVPIITFKTEKEAIEAANVSDFGGTDTWCQFLFECVYVNHSRRLQ